MKKFTLLLIITLSLILSNSNYSWTQSITSNYRCNYIKNNYFTILSSGTENEVNELWGIDKEYINSLPEVNFNLIDIDKIIKNSTAHLKARFSDIELTLIELKFERINDMDLSNNKNWVVLLTYQYDKRGYTQMIPVLIDGRIVLSNKE